MKKKKQTKKISKKKLRIKEPVKKKEENIKLQEWQRQAGKEIKESEQEVNVEIPEQVEFFKTPVRFGNIPVDTLPLGCDSKEQYRKIYPKISLPFQTTERISLGHKDLEPNQLIFGDNLHIMRALPSNSIDLIYIDPPFFSGKNYNVIFGDSNEVRSFTDIWEGGMHGYLTWLNARLLEMKRLLKPTGSIYVHLDWHASHYVKAELDKIFGYENFRREIIWYRDNPSGGKAGGNNYIHDHDIILYYVKNIKDFLFNKPYQEYTKEYIKKRFKHDDKDGKGIYRLQGVGNNLRKQYLENSKGKPVSSVWEISDINVMAKERIGYPTQKPEVLLNRIIQSSSNEGGVVADFFCGGGTTSAVAQKLGRRWITSDISKIAVSITRDRILRDVLGKNGNQKEVQHTLGKTPDIEIKSWGIYEVPELVKLKLFNEKNLSDTKKEEIEIVLENIEEIRKNFTEPIVEGILGGNKNDNK